MSHKSVLVVLTTLFLSHPSAALDPPGPPVAVDDRVMALVDGGDVPIQISSLLRNDRARGAELVVDQPPAFGTLVERGGRDLLYMPPVGFRGTVGFTYFLVGRSGVSDSATVTLHLLPRRLPVAADWDGDGGTDLGIYEPARSVMITCGLPAPIPDLYTATCAEYPLRPSSAAAWPVAIDRDGDGRTDLGLFDPLRRRFEFFTFDSDRGFRRLEITDWSQPGDLPVAGDWDGDQQKELALYRAPSHDLVFGPETAPPWNAEFDLRRSKFPDVFMPVGADWMQGGLDAPGFYGVESRRLVVYPYAGDPTTSRVEQLEIGGRVLPVTGCWGDGSCDAVALFGDEPPILFIVGLDEGGPGRAIAIPIQIGGGD